MKHVPKGLLWIIIIAVVVIAGIMAYSSQQNTMLEKTAVPDLATSTSALPQISTGSKAKSVSSGTVLPATDLSDDIVAHAVEVLVGVPLVRDAKTGIYKDTKVGAGFQHFTINSITRGDLNGDNRREAVVVGTSCNNNVCATQIFVIINKQGPATAIGQNPAGMTLSGAAQYHIVNTTISNRTVTFTISAPVVDGNHTTTTFSYQLIGTTLGR